MTLTPQQEWLGVLGGAAVVAVLYTQAPELGRPALYLVALVILFALISKGVICFTPGCKGAQTLPVFTPQTPVPA